MIMLELKDTITKNKIPIMNLTAGDQKCKIEDQEMNDRSVVNILLKYNKEKDRKYKTENKKHGM